MPVYDNRPLLAQARRAARRRSGLRRALAVIDRRVTAFAVGTVFGDPSAWVVIVAAVAFGIWISFRFR
jgi:hypothetical protein